MRDQLLFKLILLICLPLALVLSCQTQRRLLPINMPASSSMPSFTPAISISPSYTPAVFLKGTPLPASAEPVSIEQLLASPECYKDRYGIVIGFNAGYLEYPACSPWVGPYPEWGLYSELPSYQDHVMVNEPKILRIKNTI